MQESFWMQKLKALTRVEMRQLARSCHYRAEVLALTLGISRRQLHRYTRQVFQMSPQQWLEIERLTRAAHELNGNTPIKQVSSALGFKQLSHFSREFRRLHGISPSEYKSHQGSARKIDLIVRSRNSHGQNR